MSESLARRIGEREKLEQDIIDDRRLLTLYRALASELRADRFIAFVLEESMNQLATQASQELLRISDGRYSLVADGVSFEVDRSPQRRRTAQRRHSLGRRDVPSLAQPRTCSLSRPERARRHSGQSIGGDLH